MGFEPWTIEGNGRWKEGLVQVSMLYVVRWITATVENAQPVLPDLSSATRT